MSRLEEVLHMQSVVINEQKNLIANLYERIDILEEMLLIHGIDLKAKNQEAIPYTDISAHYLKRVVCTGHNKRIDTCATPFGSQWCASCSKYFPQQDHSYAERLNWIIKEKHGKEETPEVS